MDKFLETLQKAKKMFPEQRYGQLLNNALQLKFGRKPCDCPKPFLCKCRNGTGAAYDTFHMGDGDLIAALELFMKEHGK